MSVPLPSSSSSIFSLPSTCFMAGDPGYDNKKLYEYSKDVMRLDLVCPVERYKNTPKDRLGLVCFYESALGQSIYDRRRISVECFVA